MRLHRLGFCNNNCNYDNTGNLHVAANLTIGCSRKIFHRNFIFDVDLKTTKTNNIELFEMCIVQLLKIF